MQHHGLGAGPEGAFDPRRQGNRPPDYVPLEELSADDPRLHPLAPQANSANEKAYEDELTVDEQLELYHEALGDSVYVPVKEGEDYQPSASALAAQARVERAIRESEDFGEDDLVEAGFDEQQAHELVKKLRQWSETGERRGFPGGRSLGKRGKQ